MINASHRYSPLIGIAVGVFAGVVARSLYAKEWRQLLFSHEPVPFTPPFKVINCWKQVEMKGALKYLSPLYPVAAASLVDRKVHLPEKKEVICVALVATLALITAANRDRLRLRILVNEKPFFNASGHLMMATTLSCFRLQGIKHTQENHSDKAQQAAAAVSWLYAATDALLIFHTTTHYHSVADVGAGVFWGATVCGLGQLPRLFC